MGAPRSSHTPAKVIGRRRPLAGTSLARLGRSGRSRPVCGVSGRRGGARRGWARRKEGRPCPLPAILLPSYRLSSSSLLFIPTSFPSSSLLPTPGSGGPGSSRDQRIQREDTQPEAGAGGGMGVVHEVGHILSADFCKRENLGGRSAFFKRARGWRTESPGASPCFVA